MSGPESDAPAFGVETWRGSVRPAYIDEMGHMNVRHYLAIASEAMVGLAGALGMPRAFASASAATLRPREHHVRFLHEARVRAGLYMRCAVLEMGESDARILQVLFHAATHQPAAAITAWVDHVTPGDMRPFPFSKATRRLAEGLMTEAPDYALPRGLAAPSPFGPAGAVEGDALGLLRTGSGALMPAEADVFGLMAPEHLLERISHSMAHQLDRSRLAVEAMLPDLEGRLGGAMVELRQTYRRWPRVGARLELRSGLVGATAKMTHLLHWLLDPATGQAWAEADMLTVNFDLQARKAIELPEQALALVRRDQLPRR
ncbi:MAG TPA: thioesterase family protein [Caulobacteraceae bacterium]|nr:thioesterase family protein [Caulobacteraceae bacterium]